MQGSHSFFQIHWGTHVFLKTLAHMSWHPSTTATTAWSRMCCDVITVSRRFFVAHLQRAFVETKAKVGLSWGLIHGRRLNNALSSHDMKRSRTTEWRKGEGKKARRLQFQQHIHVCIYNNNQGTALPKIEASPTFLHCFLNLFVLSFHRTIT